MRRADHVKYLRGTANLYLHVLQTNQGSFRNIQVSIYECTFNPFASLHKIAALFFNAWLNSTIEPVESRVRGAVHALDVAAV